MIYFIAEHETEGPVKIGFVRFNEAHSLTRRETALARMKALQIGNPRRLILLAMIEGSVHDERGLHRRFKEHRVIGEWFSRCPDLDALIEHSRHEKRPAHPSQPASQQAIRYAMQEWRRARAEAASGRFLLTVDE